MRQYPLVVRRTYARDVRPGKHEQENQNGIDRDGDNNHFAEVNLLWRVERRRRNFTTGPSPTGPQVLHQRDQRRIQVLHPRSIASPITHVASLAQSTVSHPRRPASPEHGLRISGFANQTLRVLSSNRILLPHLLSMRPPSRDGCAETVVEQFSFAPP